MKKAELISIWGSMADMARAIGEGDTTVRNWFGRGSIPPRYDEQIIAASAKAGTPVTPADLHSVRLSMMQEGAAP